MEVFLLDINEYDNTGDNICHENGICTNTNGSFTCHWQSGYTGNGTVCNGNVNYIPIIYLILYIH